MSGLAAIQASLRQIQNLGQAETDFEIPAFNMWVKIRLLYPSEEHVVHALADAVPDEVAPFVDTYNWESVSRVLMAVKINGVTIFDFTGVTKMSQNYDREMVEVLVEEDGKERAVWMDKSSLLLPVLKSWGRDLLGVIFKKYRELADDQTSQLRQGVEFKFATLQDEIDVLTARVEVLKSRQNNTKVIEKAASTFSNIIQRPLGEQTGEVEDSLQVRDDRSRGDIDIAAEGWTDEVVERAFEEGLPHPKPEPAPVSKPKPVPAVALSPSPPQTIVLGDGTEVPVYHQDGGELVESERGISAPRIDAPPPVGYNPNFVGGDGRRVRDRSQR